MKFTVEVSDFYLGEDGEIENSLREYIIKDVISQINKSIESKVMKRKTSKYLEFYLKCMETGELPKDSFGTHNGMCVLLGVDELFELMAPTQQDEIQLLEEDLEVVYWGSGMKPFAEGEKSLFTPLRQTIVLLMHEMETNPIEE